MNRSIFRFELDVNRTYTVIWCVVLVFSIGANVAGGASMQEEGSTYDVLSIFASSVVNMTMMGAIFSMILGGLIVSREEDEKTIEFLLSHPVSRLQVAVSKTVAMVVLIVLFALVLLAADFVFLEVFKSPAGYDRGALVGIWSSQLVLFLLFGMAGLFFSSFVTKGGALVGAGIGIPIVTAVLSMLGSIDNTIMRLLSYLSPYRYLDTAAIIERGGAQPLFVLIFLALGAAFLAVALTLYRRREFAV